MERLEATVYGKVQMVFFRDYTRQCARELGLGGEVRNQDDGSVYVVAEGSPENLEKFVERLKEGPPDAKVEDLKLRWLAATGTQDVFVITDQ